MTGRLDERLVLVTGGSRGIGFGIARALAADGARVVLTSRDDRTAKEIAGRISNSPGGEPVGVAMDVADDGSVERAVRGVIEAYGTISALVNNAGITRDNLLLRLRPEDWESVLQTNLTGVYRVCRAVVPGMVRSRFGRIVNVTSVVASTGNPGQVNYAAAKAGIEGFARSLARELASRNVTVNCVAPGFIDTDMTRELDDKARTRLLEQVPMNRLGAPDDVAGAVRFLLGPDAGYVTGQTLHVNGGMYMG